MRLDVFAEEEEKILALVGFAVRAGDVTFGVPLTLEALRAGTRGKKPLVIIESSDTSPNTHKRIADKAAFYGVPAVRLTVDGEKLAHAVGRRGRTLGAVGVCEKHLAAAILAKLQ